MIEISTELNDARLVGTAARLDAAATPARIEFYASPRVAITATPGAAALVVVTLAKPCGVIAGGTLSLDVTPPPEGQVATSGDIAWGRIVDGDGVALLQGDAGLDGSGADIEVDNLTVFQGAFVRVTGGAFA